MMFIIYIKNRKDTICIIIDTRFSPSCLLKSECCFHLHVFVLWQSNSIVLISSLLTAFSLYLIETYRHLLFNKLVTKWLDLRAIKCSVVSPIFSDYELYSPKISAHQNIDWLITIWAWISNMNTIVVLLLIVLFSFFCTSSLILILIYEFALFSLTASNAWLWH